MLACAMHRVIDRAKAVMPSIVLSWRLFAARVGLIPLIVLVLARPALSSDSSPVIQGQPGAEVTAPKRPPIHSPAKRNVGRGLSRTITERLRRDQLPYVKAQVVIDPASRAKSVVLTGQVRTDLNKREAEDAVRNFFKGSTVTIDDRITLSPEIASQPASPIVGDNELEIPQVGFISKGFLGCWNGNTGGKPVTWRKLSEAGSRLDYHPDQVGICLAWRDGKLEVTDASANDIEGAEMYGFTYRLVSASGTEIKLELKSWDLTDPKNYTAKGTARCTLKPDGTVTDSMTVTTFLNGKAALLSEAVANLERDPAHPR